MSNTSSWFARKLGADSPPPTQQPQQFQPQYPQQVPPYPQQPGYPQQQQQGYQQGAPKPKVTAENFKDVAGLWEGGEATRTETTRCPKCGGNHFFSRAQGIYRGPAPAPLCADCGFNGMFDQGDASTWQA